MAYYRRRTYRNRRKHYNYSNKHKHSSFYNVFSKYHNCKWKRKYNSLQRQLRDEYDY